MTIYVVNYTPHIVHLVRADGSPWMSFPSAGVARCVERVTDLPPINWDPFGDCGMHDLLPVVAKSFGQVEGLPPPRVDVMYIVSQIVYDACPDRYDLLVPAQIVRRADGTILGCRAFSRRTREPGVYVPTDRVRYVGSRPGYSDRRGVVLAVSRSGCTVQWDRPRTDADPEIESVDVVWMGGRPSLEIVG